MIVDQSWTYRAADRAVSAFARAAARSSVRATATDAARLLRQLSGVQRLRVALVLLAAATGTYVSIEWALPANARAVVGFGAVVLVFSCASAFALLFRE